jgi:hypothetical protein
LTTYTGGGVTFTYPASWHAGGEEGQKGPVKPSSIGDVLTLLSDKQFEPVCHTAPSSDGGGETTCQYPSANPVWVTVFAPNGFTRMLLADRGLAHRTRIDGRVAWIYEGAAKLGCRDTVATREIAVGIPNDANDPGNGGVTMVACLTTTDLTQHLREVRAMVSSLKVTFRQGSSTVTADALCRRSGGYPLVSSGLVTVGWVRSFSPGGPPGAPPSVKNAFPSSPANDPAAWCWTRAPTTWTFSVVDSSGEQVTIGQIDRTSATSPPTRPLMEK